MTFCPVTMEDLNIGESTGKTPIKQHTKSLKFLFETVVTILLTL